MRYIDFHIRSLEAGKMIPNPDAGPLRTSALCDAFGKQETFRLFMPTINDKNQLFEEGKNRFCWASDSWSEQFHKYTTLRQNIIIFCAAIENEL